MTTRPGPWSTRKEPTDPVGSFAHRTLAVRVPKILDDTVAANAFPDDVTAACRALHVELVSGRLRGLTENTADRAAWDRACAPHVGKSWLDLPWYFAESFFYRRLLEATRFFGDRAGLDPFLVTKEKEEAHMLPRVKQEQARGHALEALLHLSLWGNRADLSYTAGLAHGDTGDASDLLVDDTQKAALLLKSAHRVAVLLDNAGTELAFDLLLADHLVGQGKDVVLFAKDHPFFVSDATPVDVERTRRLLGLDMCAIVAHPYMTSSGFFFTEEMTRDAPDLVEMLEGFDLVISKGDANYRRLVGDAPWPVSTPAREAMDFPAPVLALRTCKAEVVTGVDDDVAKRAAARDAEWMVSGRFGMIQLVV